MVSQLAIELWFILSLLSIFHIKNNPDPQVNKVKCKTATDLVHVRHPSFGAALIQHPILPMI